MDRNAKRNIGGNTLANTSAKAKAQTRRRRTGMAASVAAALLARSAHATTNTPDNYNLSGTGALDSAGSWSTNAIPTVTNDAVISTNPTSAVTLTIGTTQIFGSLNDTNSKAITVSATAGTLTLGGTGDLGNGVSPASADLLYVGTGATLTYGGAGALNVGQAGNFDVAGTATISSAIGGTGNLTRTGGGSLTLSSTNFNNAGTFTNSGTATAVYPSGEITSVPAGSTYINGTVGANVTGILQNDTSDLVLNNIGTSYNKGITIQNGVVLISGLNSLGAGTDTITLGNGSTTSSATLDYADKINGSSTGGTTFNNPITVGPKTGQGANVISASDYNLTLSGPITLTGGDLTLAPSNTNQSSITITGGITSPSSTGNVIVSDVANNAGNVVTFSAPTRSITPAPSPSTTRRSTAWPPAPTTSARTRSAPTSAPTSRKSSRTAPTR